MNKNKNKLILSITSTVVLLCMFLVLLFIFPITVKATLPPVIILNPLSGSVLTSNQEVECVSADNITRMYFLIANNTNEYAFDGTIGNTSDSFSTDGWKQTIDISAFADGIYNLTVRAFAYDGSNYILEATDTETNIKIDHTSPAGTIIINGPNGTIQTGTKNVMLNLTYSDNYEVDKCRYANDLESNLVNSIWESCTNSKLWMLSQSSGNKTVYYQIKDLGGNTITYNDSILYYPGYDYTAPTIPTVYDGLTGEDINWTNDNTSLTAHWFNSTEDISTIYYKYKIWNDTECIIGCNWLYSSEELSVLINGLSLDEGTMYKFEVQAYNSGNISSISAFSDGITVDKTAPEMPIINSTTHPDDSIAYPISNAHFNWTASDISNAGVSSGVIGYSYSIDQYPETTPDIILDSRWWELIQESQNSGYEQVMKINSTGTAYAIYSQIATDLEENQSVRVEIDLAERISDYSDLMSYNVSIIRVLNGVAITTFVQGAPIANVIEKNTDISYSPTMDLSTSYQYNFTINTTTNDTDYDIYVVITADPTDDDNRRNYSIGGTNDPARVDTNTKAYVCTESNICTDNSTIEYAISFEKSDVGDEWETAYNNLGDGIYYFHVRARDLAGNWGNVSHKKIIIDAGGVSVGISSPIDGEIFATSTTSKNISVKVLVSSNATVNVSVVHSDGSIDVTPSTSFRNIGIFEDVYLEYGINEIYATATTNSGAITNSKSVFVIITADEFPVTNKTLKVSYGGSADYSGTYMVYDDEGDAYVGIAVENQGSFSGITSQTNTELNSIKIFMTSPIEINRRTAIESDLGENLFLDRENPVFGNIVGFSNYVLRGELRYEDVYLGGMLNYPSGTYKIILFNEGLTEEGDVNISVTGE